MFELICGVFLGACCSNSTFTSVKKNTSRRDQIIPWFFPQVAGQTCVQGEEGGSDVPHLSSKTTLDCYKLVFTMNRMLEILLSDFKTSSCCCGTKSSEYQLHTIRRAENLG